MKIAIDLTALSYHMSGIERHALNMTRSLLNIDAENEYILIFRNDVFPDLKIAVDNQRVKVVILKGNHKLLFYQITLLKNLYKIKADKYLFFSFVSPVLFWKNGIYNTIPDTSAWDYPQSMTLLHKLYGRVSAHVAIKASEKILTISNFSKERIIDLLHVPENKIIVTPCGVSHEFLHINAESFANVKKKHGIPNKFIMSLSTLEPRKNLTLLLEAYKQIEKNVDYDLILVGRLGWKINAKLQPYLSDPRIHFTGFVEDEEVITLYKNTICFVFPSAYEGFGLPPLEALSFGAPVLSSDAASLPEVLRNQAVFFKNNSKENLVNLLLNLEHYVANMPHSLDDYQIKTFDYNASAKKLFNLIMEGNT